MKDKYDRVKNFVKKHRVPVAASTGLALGAYGTYKYMSNHMLMEVFTPLSPEEVKAFLEGNDGHMTFVLTNLNNRTVSLHTGIPLPE